MQAYKERHLLAEPLQQARPCQRLTHPCLPTAPWQCSQAAPRPSGARSANKLSRLLHSHLSAHCWHTRMTAYYLMQITVVCPTWLLLPRPVLPLKMPTQRVSNMPAAGHSGQFSTARRSASQTRAYCFSLSLFPSQLGGVTCGIGHMQHTCCNAFHPQLELRIPLSLDAGVSIEPECMCAIIRNPSVQPQMIYDTGAANSAVTQCCADALSTCQADHCRMRLPNRWQVRSTPAGPRGQCPMLAALRKPADGTT